MATPRPAASRIAALALAACLALSPLAATAQQQEERPSTAVSAFTGIGSVLATLVYAPLKLTHAVTGTVVSGLAWLVTGGNGDVASTVFKTSVGGDYVVTPDHLRGRRKFRLQGEPY